MKYLQKDEYVYHRCLSVALGETQQIYNHFVTHSITPEGILPLVTLRCTGDLS